MVLTLPESRRLPSRRPGLSLVSVVLHAGVLIALARAGSAVAGGSLHPAQTVMLRFLPVERPVVREPGGGAGASAALPTRDLPAPPRLTLPDVSVPSTAISVVTSAANDVVSLGGSNAGWGRGTAVDTSAARPATRDIFDAGDVDRAVQPLGGNPAPGYPAALAAAGYEGSVLVRFVVDTLGAVERGSVAIVRSTHPLFERAVRQALARMRFSPAESRGRRVRQLVEQSFQFAMKR